MYADSAITPTANRRQTLTKAGALLLIFAAQRAEPVGAEVQYAPPTIQPNLAPKQGTFDPTDEDLRDAAGLLQRALNAEEVQVCVFTLPLSGVQSASAQTLFLHRSKRRPC